MDLRLMSSASSATTYADYLRDITQSTLRARQLLGAAPDTLGVTVPVQRPSNAGDLVSMAKEWQKEVRRKKGAAGYDMADTPHEASYLQRRFDFISGEESARRYAYDDATGQTMRGQEKRGNVTVGIGFNMDRSDARQVMNRALGLSDKQFDDVYSGKRALSDLEVRKLFDYTAKEAEEIVDRKLGDVALPEHKRIALVSLAFNSPSLIGPKLTAAIKEGNWKGALQEILFNSNRRAHRGLASRRYREAVMFNGAADAEASLPEFREYMSAVGDRMQMAALSDYVDGSMPDRSGEEPYPKTPLPITGKRA